MHQDLFSHNLVLTMTRSVHVEYANTMSVMPRVSRDAHAPELLIAGRLRSFTVGKRGVEDKLMRLAVGKESWSR